MSKTSKIIEISTSDIRCVKYENCMLCASSEKCENTTVKDCRAILYKLSKTNQR